MRHCHFQNRVTFTILILFPWVTLFKNFFFFLLFWVSGTWTCYRIQQKVIQLKCLPPLNHLVTFLKETTKLDHLYLLFYNLVCFYNLFLKFYYFCLEFYIISYQFILLAGPKSSIYIMLLQRLWLSHMKRLNLTQYYCTQMLSHMSA